MASAFDILADYFRTQRQQRRQDQLLADERSFILGREREAREFQSQRYAELDKVNTDYANQIAGEIEDLTSQFETERRKFEAEAARSAMKVAVEKMPEKLREKFTEAGAIGSNGSVVPDTFLDLMGSLKGSDADAAKLAYDQAMSSVLEAKEDEFRTRVRTIERAITSKQTLYRQVVGDIRDKSGLEPLGNVDSQSSPTQGLLPEKDIEEVIGAAGDKVGSIGGGQRPTYEENELSRWLGGVVESPPAHTASRLDPGKMSVPVNGTAITRGIESLGSNVGSFASEVGGSIKESFAQPSINTPTYQGFREGRRGLPSNNLGRSPSAFPMQGVTLPANPSIQPAPPAQSNEQVAAQVSQSLFGTSDPNELQAIHDFATGRLGYTEQDAQTIPLRALQGDPEAESHIRRIRSAWENQGLGLLR